jgi:hypothetical protein
VTVHPERIRAALRIVPFVVIVAGIVFRILYYFSDRSLWLDEATMALAAIDSPWNTIVKPMYKNIPAAAPIGYVVTVKLLISLFGSSEYVLRLFSIIPGVLSLVLFWKFLNNNFNKNMALIAIAFFSLNQHLIYYSTEVKFYAIDVLSTILLLLTFYEYCRSKKTKSIIIFSLGALMLQWFSFTTIIVSVGLIATKLFTQMLHEKRGSPDSKLAGSGIIIVLHFVFYKYFFIDHISGSSQLNSFWGPVFAPLPVTINALSWYIRFVPNFMQMPCGFTSMAIISLVFIFYGASIYFKNEKFSSLLLMGILFITFCLSLMKLYPVYSRLGLFLVPIIIIFITIGLENLLTHKRWIQGAGALCLLLLLGVPSINVIRNVYSPFRPEHIKPLVKCIADSAKTNDHIYVYYGAVPAFEYYAKMYSLQSSWTSGKKTINEIDNYLQDILINKSQNPSVVWLLFTHVHSDTVNEEEFILNKMARYGKQVAYFHKFAAASLYKFAIPEQRL